MSTKTCLLAILIILLCTPLKSPISWSSKTEATSLGKLPQVQDSTIGPLLPFVFGGRGGIGPNPNRSYSWLYTEESCIVGLENPYGMQETEPAYKTSTLPAALFLPEIEWTPPPHSPSISSSNSFLEEKHLSHIKSTSKGQLYTSFILKVLQLAEVKFNKDWGDGPH